jgi:tetratricopeptide (TPR) repeat protein
MPFILLIVYVFSGALSENAYINRDFTLEERLLTQARIIFQYLTNILLPGLQTPSLFHDDYMISKNIFHPWTTLISMLGIIALIIISWLSRNKIPLLSFSIAWFFIGHILESTIIPLELYFEHRNYLPILGPLLALVYFTIKALEYFTHGRKAIMLGVVVFTFLLTGTTLVNTIMWGRPVELIVGSSQEHPESARAIEALEALELEMGFEIKDQKIKARLQNLYQGKNAHSSYVLFRDLKYSCFQGDLSTEKLNNTLTSLHQSIYEASAANALNSFVLDWVEGRCKNISSKEIIDFLDALTGLKQLQYGFMPHIIQYNLSRLWEKERNFAKTMMHLEKAYRLKPELGGLLLQASYLTSAGYHDAALELLRDTSLLETSFRKQLVLVLRQPEIDRVIARVNENKKKLAIHANR